MARLWLDSRAIEYERIVAGEWGECSPYAEMTLAFCRRWLNGAQTFVLNTSGSTGTPKPITLQRQQLLASARLTGEALGLQAGMPALVCVNTGFVAGVMMLVRGFEFGLEMVVVEPSRNPIKHAPTPATGEWRNASFFNNGFTAMVPMQVQAVLDDMATRDVLNGMHSLLIGGAAVSQSLVDALQGLDVACYHTYGMTETVSHVALRRLNGAAASERFVPFAGIELAFDARGCLTISGPMTLGETVVTNDRVAIRDDGSFVWLGRIDNVINSGGVKVQAEKVERALERCITGRRLFVVGLPDEVLGETVVAFIEGEPIELPQELSGLSRYEFPKRFYFVEAFAETESGKVDRKRTRSTRMTPGAMKETC